MLNPAAIDNHIFIYKDTLFQFVIEESETDDGNIVEDYVFINLDTDEVNRDESNELLRYLVQLSHDLLHK